jgi:predicted pyridoxine 5'-phosphate oxidase superfamily flavin-nucleotide-binding protein
MHQITDEVRAAMQGIIPSTLVTCAADGTPNVAYISQVYYVDNDHVALSHQFFNKTTRNIRDNPQICVSIVSPETFEMWRIDGVFIRSETTGKIYDEMNAQLEAIASMTGMEDVFHLKSADIYKITGLEKMA